MKNRLTILQNKKVLLGIFSLLICIALIAVCSFVPFIIDPSQWQTTEFLTDELIICAIVIMSMVSMILIGQADNAEKEGSNIAKARAQFFINLKLVTDRFAFSQWVKKVMQPRDIQAIRERKLRKLGITDYDVLNLDKKDIKSLIYGSAEINGKWYLGINKEQAEGIIDIKFASIGDHFVEPDYYLSVKKSIDNRTRSERASDEDSKKTWYLGLSIISKLILTVVTAMIFASLMRDLTTQIDKGAAWMKFASRMWSMLSSSFMGYSVGVQINDIDAEYIEMRSGVLIEYNQDKNFKPETVEEMAKREAADKLPNSNLIPATVKEQ